MDRVARALSAHIEERVVSKLDRGIERNGGRFARSLLGQGDNVLGHAVTAYRGNSAAAGGVVKTFTADTRSRSTTVPGLTHNKAYLCKARAINRYGAGAYRNQRTCGGVSAKVNLDKPTSGIRLQSGRKGAIYATGYRPSAHAYP